MDVQDPQVHRSRQHSPRGEAVVVAWIDHSRLIVFRPLSCWLTTCGTGFPGVDSKSRVVCGKVVKCAFSAIDGIYKLRYSGEPTEFLNTSTNVQGVIMLMIFSKFVRMELLNR